MHTCIPLLLFFLVLGLFYLMWRSTSQPSKNTVIGNQTAINWLEKPKARYQDLVNEYGEPKSADFSSGGYALWDGKNTSPFDEIIIRDEEVPHCCPKEHYDFLLASLCLDIKDSKDLMTILSLSKSVWYDQLKKMLWVRCHFMGANVATALLATRVLTGKLDGKTTIPKEDIHTLYMKEPEVFQALYKKLIMTSMDSSTYKEYLNELKENLKTLGQCKISDKCNSIDCSNLI